MAKFEKEIKDDRRKSCDDGSIEAGGPLEASAYKDVELRRLRNGGVKRAEANQRAWEAMAEKYPPPPTEETAGEKWSNALYDRLQEVAVSWLQDHGCDTSDSSAIDELVFDLLVVAELANCDSPYYSSGGEE